jgi:hypothetical protein
MYMPPFDLLVRELQIPRDDDGRVEVSRAFLVFLLRCQLALSEFDEEAYCNRHTDVRAAVDNGELPSGRMHFIWEGYFEGRESAADNVDEAWYLDTYPDVAAAIERGDVASARDHYRNNGIYEWRSPNAAIEPHLHAWHQVLRGLSEKSQS